MSQLASLDFPATRAAWDRFTADGSTVMNDRATQEINAPGSTFKLVVAATRVGQRLPRPTRSSTLRRRCSCAQSTHQLSNLAACGNTTKTMDQALTLSCNTSFANIGMALGEDKIKAQAEAFGFNSSLGDGLTSAASVYPTGMSQAELAMASTSDVRCGCWPAADGSGGRCHRPVLATP